MDSRYYQPQVQVLYCEHEVLSSWNFSDLRSPFWRLYRNEVAEPREVSVIAIHFKAHPTFLELPAVASGGSTAAWPAPAKRPGLARDGDGWRYDVHPGSLLLIPPETAFRTRASTPFRQFYLHFQALPPFDRLPMPCLELSEGSTALHQAIDGLCEQIATQDCGTRALERRGISQAPLPFTLACHALALEALRAVPQTLLTPPILEPRVAEALTYLRSHLDRAVPVAELASRARMHPHAFNALFKRHTGSTITQWHLAERIARACVLLSFTRAGIGEIATACGFLDRYHFTRVFSRLRGRGPAGYRREVT